MGETMIEAIGLTKLYGAVKAVDNINFQIHRGEVVGFLGPNGAGKTTTMKMITCFVAPTAGTVKVNGADVFEDSLGVRRSLGYLPESTPLYVEMTVAEYLQFVAEMRHLRGETGTKQMRKAVEETGLGDVLHKEIRALSKGYRQRVGLAQALVHEPPILILDEPMSGLDPNQAVEIRDLIRHLGKERTVILSTHNLAEVQVACSRVLIIAKGKLVADSSPQDLMQHAGKPRFVVAVLVTETGNAQQVAIEVHQALSRVPGVEKVRMLESANPSEVTFEVLPLESRDLRSELSRAVTESRGTLVGLRREDQNLESIFRQLTLGESSESASQTSHDSHAG
jgi:ABC-2 type transport system ATP-binding protein